MLKRLSAVLFLFFVGCPPQQPATEVIAKNAFLVECPNWHGVVQGQVTKTGNVYTFTSRSGGGEGPVIHTEGPCTIEESTAAK